MRKIKVPTVGESITEVTLLKWLKKDGEIVIKDEILCELESEKATFELNAEINGTLHITTQEGDTLKIGDVICIIGENDLQRALFLLEQCLLEKTDHLDLGRCGLTSADFEDGGELNTLLSQCAHLQTLILSNEWWIWEGRRTWWVKKVSKNPGNNNYFNSLPSGIAYLTNLSTLICCGNMGDNWNIKYIDIIKNLRKIDYLDLRDNSIELLNSLQYLTSLRKLYLNRNKIRSVKFLQKLEKLVHLDIHTNRIESLDGILTLPSLRNLDIHNNLVKDITGLENLTNLEELYISENSIEDINGLEYLMSVDGELHIEIEENPFVKEYQLQLLNGENHLPFLKELFMRQKDEAQKAFFNYPVKILMLGNHACGKSSLVNYLANKKSDGSTHILRIENYFITDASKTNILPDGVFFDFGGQDFYHGLYQAFISRDALQIILFNGSKDKNETLTDSSNLPIINFNRRYWLGQKNYQENNSNSCSPYILIQTFAETETSESTPVDYTMYKGHKKSFFLSLCESFDEGQQCDIDFYNIGKQYFKTYFDGLLRKLQVETKEPVWYIDFLKYIFDKRGKNHLPTRITDVLPFYKAEGLSTSEKLKYLATNLITLHRHGLVLYYPHIKGLEEIVWLNPQKLVEYVQQNILDKKFIDSAKYSTPGVISRSGFEERVKDETILLLLKEQKVIFLHKPTDKEEDEEYIIPNFLPLVDRRNADLQLLTFGLDKPDFIIKFNDFIPFGFINQMICFFGKQPDVKKFWRNQLLFTLSNEARVLFELDLEQLKINVYFQLLQKSNLSDRSYVTEYLFICMVALYWDFKSDEILEFKEFIECKENKDASVDSVRYSLWTSLQSDSKFIPPDLFISTDGRRYVRYSDLFQLKTGDFKITSYGLKHDSIDLLDLKEISTKYFLPYTNKKLSAIKNVFISYSKHDEDYLQEFEDHLVTLKQEGVAVFNCRKIEFGKEWDEEVKRQIDDCDIMICLVSIKFLNTDYITAVEIKRAIAQNKIIVPIVIKACDWENSTLGIYQAAQRGKIVSLDNNLKLLGRIRSYSKEERDAFWTDIIKEFRSKFLLS